MNMFWMKLHPSAVQVVQPVSGCDINTIARNTILVFILRPRAGSLTCNVNGYSFILSIFAFDKYRAHVENYCFLLLIPTYPRNLVLFHKFL